MVYRTRSNLFSTQFMIIDNFELQLRIKQTSSRSKEVPKSNTSFFRTNLGPQHENIAKKSACLCAVAFIYTNIDIHQIQTIQFHQHTKTNKNTRKTTLLLHACPHCPYLRRKLLKLATKRAHIGHFTQID